MSCLIYFAWKLFLSLYSILLRHSSKFYQATSKSRPQFCQTALDKAKSIALAKSSPFYDKTFLCNPFLIPLIRKNTQVSHPHLDLHCNLIHLFLLIILPHSRSWVSDLASCSYSCNISVPTHTQI